jgi:signal transduction histidine kinase
MRANDHMAIADLQRTNNILRQLDRNKLEFIQVAAHELRTPLTVLNGYVKLLRSFPDISNNPVVTDVINGIIKGSERIHEVVNLMLDVTRIDTETLKVVPEAVPLMDIIQNLVRDLERAAAERRLVFSIVYGADTPNIYGDPSLIRKALYQLIINAIKYTPDGGRIAITTRSCRVDSEVPGAEIIVKDTGIGLDKEHYELIFEKFYQVGSVAIHSSGRTTFKGGGPGLGLAIVRGVTRAHGGKVWVESPGHDEVNLPGSTFFLQLPIMPPALQAPTRPQG